MIITDNEQIIHTYTYSFDKNSEYIMRLASILTCV